MNEHTDQKRLRESAYSKADALDRRNAIQEDFSNRATPWFRWVLERLDLSETAAVLELGCGSGTLWLENQPRLSPGWHLTLSDLSPGMLRDAKKSLKGLKPEPVFAVLDAQSLPFEDGQFDAVLAIGLLDHLPDVPRAAREIRRVLRHGGKLLASAGGSGHLRELRKRLKPFLPKQKSETLGGAAERFGLENGEAILKRIFQQVTRYDYFDRLVFEEAQPVIDYVLSERSIQTALDPERLGGFVNRIRRELARRGQIQVSVEKGLFVAAREVGRET